jgi:hypothetical protein
MQHGKSALKRRRGRFQGMHWSAFEQPHADHYDFVNMTLAGMMHRFKTKFPGIE